MQKITFKLDNKEYIAFFTAGNSTVKVFNMSALENHFLSRQCKIESGKLVKYEAKNKTVIRSLA
jgi:hypothetical protein